MPIRKGPDGRKFHMSNTGVDPLVEPSESEKELPSLLSAPTGSVKFSNIMNEASTGIQSTKQIAEAPHRDIAASRNRFGPDLLAPTAIHNWVPESHPADGTEAYTTREDSIKKERDGLRRATARACEAGHVVLVIWWSPSDPVNRKGTWSLEIFDCRFELWGDFGIEAHEQCELSIANDIVNALAKAMKEEWRTVLSTNKEHTNPVCEWNKDNRKLQNDKYNERSLPALRKIEREIRPMVVCALGRVPRGQSNGPPDDKGGQDKNDEEEKGRKKDQELTKEELIAKRKAAQKKVNLANLAAKMGDQAQRTAESRKRVEASEKLRRDAQRNANGTQAIYDSDSRSFVPRPSISRASPLEMTAVVENVPSTPSKTKKKESNNKTGSKKTTKTEEEDADLKRIQAAARRDRERQDQEERAEEERQGELAAQQEEIELRERAALEADQDTSLDEDLDTAVKEALDNVSPEPEASEEQPAKTSQEGTDNSESATDSPINKPGPKDHKRKLKPRAPVTPVTPDSSDSDSFRPPQPSTPVETKPKAKSKAKPEMAKTTSETKKTKATRESKTEETKSARKEGAEASKGKENKKYKSEEFIADSDLENDETDDVKLFSDKLQSANVRVETTEATTTTVQSEHGNEVVEDVVETTTVAIEVQQREGSVERTEVKETTTARSDSSEQGETIVEHTTHVETVIQVEIPHQRMPHDSPLSSPGRDLQVDFNTPTNALGIDVSVTPPPPSPTRSDSSSSSRKHKSPSLDEEPQNRKINPPTSPSAEEGAAAAEVPESPRADDAQSSENAASPETTTASPRPAPDSVATSNEPSTPPPIERAATAASEHAASSPKPATTSPPSSPAASVKSSTSSASSKKRKATWSEENGEVTISPGGTKRAKRVQLSGIVVSEGIEREGNVDGEGETDISQQAHAEIVIGLDNVAQAEAEDDEKSYDSLFHGSSQQDDQSNA